MNNELMVKPSSLMPSGIELNQFVDIYLFQFNDQLQSRLEVLLEKSKAQSLTPEESAEGAGISELSRIFTLINAQLAAKAKWCPAKFEESFDSDNEPNSPHSDASSRFINLTLIMITLFLILCLRNRGNQRSGKQGKARS